jgi:hypothetical protein
MLCGAPSDEHEASGTAVYCSVCAPFPSTSLTLELI